MGATIFGGTQKERIQFNEKTLWTGGPSESRVYDYGNIPGKYEVLQDIRELFKEGKNQEAAAKTGQLAGKNADVEANGFGDYQNFGDMFFDFSFNPNHIENYVRDLDLSTEVATVGFDYQGIGYKREYFMNYPDNVMVMKFTATEKESIDFDLSFVSAQGGVPIYEGDQIILRGELKDNQMIYESQVKVIPTGGKVTSESDKIKIEDADEVLILMTAGTNYKYNFPVYRGEDGQIKEWYEETTLGSLNTDRHHRHLSHLLGLFPGDHISKETPEYLEAAKVSLNDRGDRSYGWAMGHRMNMWARIGDGERAYQLIEELMKYGMYNNLWDIR